VGVRAWSTKYRAWLKGLDFDSSALQTTFDEYRLSIEEIESRIESWRARYTRKREKADTLR
jgi:predicted  nucleic acid-binding Zn-ribbon protein